MAMECPWLTAAYMTASGKMAAMGTGSTQIRQDVDMKGCGSVDNSINMGFSSIPMGICIKESGVTGFRTAMESCTFTMDPFTMVISKMDIDMDMASMPGRMEPSTKATGFLTNEMAMDSGSAQIARSTKGIG